MIRYIGSIIASRQIQTWLCEGEAALHWFLSVLLHVTFAAGAVTSGNHCLLKQLPLHVVSEELFLPSSSSPSLSLLLSFPLPSLLISLLFSHHFHHDRPAARSPALDPPTLGSPLCVREECK